MSSQNEYFTALDTYNDPNSSPDVRAKARAALDRMSQDRMARREGDKDTSRLTDMGAPEEQNYDGVGRIMLAAGAVAVILIILIQMGIGV